MTMFFKNLKSIVSAFITLLLFACNNNSDNKKEGYSDINEQLFIELGGEKQYVEIMGVSKEKPILLFSGHEPFGRRSPYI